MPGVPAATKRKRASGSTKRRINHAEAIRSFRAAQEIDPGCAMCFWGEALVLGPNINVPMMPEANAPALALYRSPGFEDAYHYHYRRPPGAAAE